MDSLLLGILLLVFGSIGLIASIMYVMHLHTIAKIEELTEKNKQGDNKNE